MVETLRKPPWCSQDVEFDHTGGTQRGWAREGAAAYRAAHPERYGVAPSVTDSVTEAKSVTPSVTDVAEAERSVTPSVTVSKGALRAKRWREKQRK